MTPRVMILDEPTSMLDPISRKRVFDVLFKLKQEQHNTVIVEHSLENLMPLADRMVLISEGKLLFEDETREFFQNMGLLMERGITPAGAMRVFHDLAAAGLYHGDMPLTVEEGRCKPSGKVPYDQRTSIWLHDTLM